MSIWTREEEAFKNLPPERQANIEIVSSAYASVFAQKAYLTMPVTTGKRYYDVLDRYGVKSVEELEQKRPGALREEIIIPNIEEGKALAARIRQDNEIDALVVSGIFEARKQRWTQEEYMVLWLRFITSSASAVYLSDGWAYSNGGAIEFVRALAKSYRLVGEAAQNFDHSRPTIEIYNHRGERVDFYEGAIRLYEAIRDLQQRGYGSDVLRDEFALLEGILWHVFHSDEIRSVSAVTVFAHRWDKVTNSLSLLDIGANRELKGL